jgi:peptidoglycan/xylan/chitin deacetylase (PgdA/CDA1 family)
MLGLNDRLSILIYHRVLQRPDPLFPDEVDAARFNEQLRVLKRYFRLMPLQEAVEALIARRLPPRAATITFDDGYADNLTIAAPVLAGHGVPATVFVATGYLDGGCMFNDIVIEAIRRTRKEQIDLEFVGLGTVRVGSLEARRNLVDQLLRALKYLPEDERLTKARRIAKVAEVEPPRDLMLSTSQVRELRRLGIRIGAHTVTHPILTRLSTNEAREQIAGGRARLEETLAERVTLFAYPNGKPHEDFGPEHARMVADLGFDAAVTTAWGAASVTSDRFQLPRFTPWDRSPTRFALRLFLSRLRPPPAPLLPIQGDSPALETRK